MLFRSTAGIDGFTFIHEIINGKRQVIFYITDGGLVRNADLPGIEAVYIDKDTKIRDFKRDLMLGEVFYR